VYLLAPSSTIYSYTLVLPHPVYAKAGNLMFLCQLCSPEIPKINFHVELDAAKATWLSNDIVMFSTKTGEMLLLTVVYDGRYDIIHIIVCPIICATVLDFIGMPELNIISSSASIFLQNCA
jgi:hypothetical protein